MYALQLNQMFPIQLSLKTSPNYPFPCVKNCVVYEIRIASCFLEHNNFVLKLEHSVLDCGMGW